MQCALSEVLGPFLLALGAGPFEILLAEFIAAAFLLRGIAETGRNRSQVV